MDQTKIIFTRKKLLESIGFEKASSRSLQILADQIQRTTKKEIGYNTLRRFFGLLGTTNPNAKTWMIFQNYLKKVLPADAMTKAEYVENWHPYHSLYLYLFKRDLKGLIQFLKDNKSKDHYPQLLGNLTCQLITAKEIPMLTEIYKQDELFGSTTNFAIFFAEVICGTLKMLPVNDLTIFHPVFSLPNFKNSVFYYHIDYAHLNGYYGHFLTLFQADTEHEKLFLDCILGYWSFLKGQSLVQIKKHSLDTLARLYPVLAGRYIGYQLLQFPLEAEKIIQKLVLPADKFFEPHYFFVEIFPALLLNKDMRTVQFLFEQYYEPLYEMDHWYSYVPFNIYLISEAMMYVYEDDMVRAKIIYNSINIELVSSAYYSYIKLFYLVLSYQVYIEEETKSQILEEYQLLAKQTGFRRFSDEFIVNYFNW
jgi:hypothetical protein